MVLITDGVPLGDLGVGSHPVPSEWDDPVVVGDTELLYRVGGKLLRPHRKNAKQSWLLTEMVGTRSYYARFFGVF